MMKVLIAAGVLALAFASACGPREHIRSEYGEATKAFFARQVINPEPAPGTPRGLDSEEASLIHQTYREQLGAEKSGPQDPSTRVILLDQDGKNVRTSR